MADDTFDPDSLQTAPAPASASMKVRPQSKDDGDDKDKKSALSPAMRGVLDKIIAPGESAGKYDVIYGGKRVDDLSKHPDERVLITSGPNKGLYSTAAGKYQFIKGTWDAAAKATGRSDFSPESQDINAAWLAAKTYKDATGRDIEADYTSGDPKLRDGIKRALASQWESLGKPGPRVDKLDREGNPLFSDYAMKEHDGRPNTDVLMMAPQQYLDLSPEIDGKPFETPSGRSLMRSFNKGEPIESIPTMDVNVAGPTATVTDQDGRHRALLAQHQGIEAIPVALRKTGAGDPKEIVGMSGTTMAHDFPKASEYQPAAAKPDGSPADRGEADSHAQSPSDGTQQEAQPQQPTQEQARPSLFSQVSDAIVPKAGAAEPRRSATGEAVDAKPEDDPYAQFVAPRGEQAATPATTQSAPEDDPYAQFVAHAPEVVPQGDVTASQIAAREQSIEADKSVPFQDQPGEHRATILPVGYDDKGELIRSDVGMFAGWPKLFMPGMLAPIARGAVEGGQEALGERPVGDPRVAGDLAAAAGLAGGMTPSGTGMRAAVRTGEDEFRPMYEMVSRVVGEDISKNPAAMRIVERMEASARGGGPTAQDMLDLLNSAPGKPLTLMDMGDENLLALAGKMARSPGEARQTMAKFLNNRDLFAGRRLANDVNEGIASGSSYDAAAALNQARAVSAKPEYEAAYKYAPINPDEMKPNGAIGALLNRPSMRAGMANARKIAAEEGVDMNTLGIDLDEQGEPRFAKVPTWQTLDYVKRGVDNVVEQYRDKTTGKLVLDTYGRAADHTRTDYRNILKTLNPDYAKALSAYSGPSTSLDALRAGQDFLRQRPEEIARRIGTYEAGDREFYKIGAADTLRTALAKKGAEGDEAKAIIGSQYLRDKLRPLFNDDASYDRFIKSVEAERRMFDTRFDVLRGSQTAARRAEDATSAVDEAAAHAARGAQHVASGNFLGAGIAAARTAMSLRGLNDPALNASIAKFLTTDLSEQSTRGRVNALADFMYRIPATRRVLESAQSAPPASRLMLPAGNSLGANVLGGGSGNGNSGTGLLGQ